MFLATRRHLKDVPLSVDREEFNNRYSLFVFNLSPGGDNDTMTLVSNATLRLGMRFRALLPFTTTLIIYTS